MPQDITALLSGLLQPQGAAAGVSGAVQPADLTDENGLEPFLTALQSALQQQLGDAQAGDLVGDPQALLAAVEQGLRQSQAANGGNLLPAAATTDIDRLLEEIRLSFGRNDGESVAFDTAKGDPAVLLNLSSPVLPGVDYSQDAGSGETTPIGDLRRLLARLNVIMNGARQTADTPAAGDSAQSGPLQQSQDLAALALRKEHHETADGLAGAVLKESAQPLNGSQAVAMNPLLFERQMAQLALKRQTGSDLPGDSESRAELISAVQPGQPGRIAALQAAPADSRVQQVYVATPLGDSQWQADFGGKLMMLAKGGVQGQTQVAEIRLNPQHMGPIEVRVVLQDDQTSVTFAAHHNAVREAIETSLPRLREMFNTAGLMLADAQVSDQSPYDRRQYEQPNSGNGRSAFSMSNMDDELQQIVSQLDIPTVTAVPQGLDIYA